MSDACCGKFWQLVCVVAEPHFCLGMQTISNLKTQMRMLVGAEWTDPAGPYKNVVELWDGEVPEENLRLL